MRVFLYNTFAFSAKILRVPFLVVILPLIAMHLSRVNMSLKFRKGFGNITTSIDPEKS